MKTSLLRAFSFVLGLTVSASPAFAEVIDEGIGIVYGKNYAYSLKAPPGSVLDNQSGVDQGMHAVFYPKGGSWSDSPVVAYATARPVTKTVQTADDAAKFVIADFHSNGSPNYVGKRVGTVKTESGEGVIYHFSGDEYGNYEAVAYYVEKKTINFVVLTARNQKEFEKVLPAFQKLAASYVYLGDAPMKESKPPAK